MMPLGTFPRGLNVPPPAKDSTPVDYAEALGETYLSFSKQNHRKSVGHYLTPATIARFMADCSSYSEPYMRVLDPGSGTGILSAAVCEAASGGGTVKRLHVDAYETDPVLTGLTRLVLTFSRRWLGQRGVALTFDVRHGDFVLESAATLEAVSKANGHEGNDRSRTEYGLVISNPHTSRLERTIPEPSHGRPLCMGRPIFMPCSWRFPPSCYRSPGSSSTSCRGASRQDLTSGDSGKPSSDVSLRPLSTSSSPGRKYSRTRPCSRRTWCSQAGGGGRASLSMRVKSWYPTAGRLTTLRAADACWWR